MDGRSSIRIIKRGAGPPCHSVRFVVLCTAAWFQSVRFISCIHPKLAGFVDNQRGTAGKEDLKATTRFRSNRVFLGHFISQKRELKVKKILLFFMLSSACLHSPRECCFTDSGSSVVSVTHWAFLRGPSLCHIHLLIHTYLFRYHQLGGGKLMPDYSRCRTTAQRPAALYALISLVWDAPGCRSASPSCSLRIMVMLP